MSQRDKTDMIYDALLSFQDEVRENMREARIAAKEHQEEMKAHKIETKVRLDRIDKRIDKIEEPSKALRFIGKTAVWFTAVGTAIALLFNAFWRNV